jgi:hypothetical protein
VSAASIPQRLDRVVQAAGMKHLLLVLPVVFVLGACGTPVPPVTCSAANCEGCCDSADKCRVGNQEAACGTAGLACNVCVTGQLCQSSLCVFSNPGPDAGTDAGTDGGADAGTDGGTDAGSLCPATAVTCSDQAIQSLDLKNTVNAAAIVNVGEDAGFRTTIDATAGGFTPTMSYVYGTFTNNGMLKVSISDEASLSSLDWDIGFRRFVIRLNSGSSGPSCVKAAATASGTVYDTLLSAPPGGNYVSDDFEGAPPTCTFKDDGSGLTTSPSTALANTAASFYAYNNCVAMTGRVFVVRTRQGRHVRLVVTNYYPTDAAQMTCNSGTSPGVAGATIRVRWSFLD